MWAGFAAAEQWRIIPVFDLELICLKLLTVYNLHIPNFILLIVWLGPSLSPRPKAWFGPK